MAITGHGLFKKEILPLLGQVHTHTYRSYNKVLYVMKNFMYFQSSKPFLLR